MKKSCLVAVIAVLAAYGAALIPALTVTAFSFISVENAQTHLWTQNQSLEAAQREASG